MNTKIKVENLKIGDKIYHVPKEYSKERIHVIERIVTGISLNRKGNLRAYLDYSNYPEAFDWGGYFSYSKSKALKVSEHFKEQLRNKEKRRQQKDLIYQNNQANIATIEDKLMNKVVMVYVGEGRWIKATVTNMWTSDKRGRYYFTTSPRGSGAYLTKREGKNWYFWSELDELEKKREELDKKIQSLKEKQGKKDA
jgi:hypothetical protein